MSPQRPHHMQTPSPFLYAVWCSQWTGVKPQNQIILMRTAAAITNQISACWENLFPVIVRIQF